jgi:hypothetical protein
LKQREIKPLSPEHAGKNGRFWGRSRHRGAGSTRGHKNRASVLALYRIVNQVKSRGKSAGYLSKPTQHIDLDAGSLVAATASGNWVAGNVGFMSSVE